MSEVLVPRWCSETLDNALRKHLRNVAGICRDRLLRGERNTSSSRLWHASDESAERARQAGGHRLPTYLCRQPRHWLLPQAGVPKAGGARTSDEIVPSAMSRG
eukprot:5454148-Pleurochrysis_carterae.AAC.1